MKKYRIDYTTKATRETPSKDETIFFEYEDDANVSVATVLENFFLKHDPQTFESFTIMTMHG